MERIKSNKIVSALLTSDWHLREDTPTCFIGNWHQEQWKAVELVRNLQARYKCPVLHAGDLFHHWKPSPALISQTLWFLPEDFYTIYGQHDLPQHSWELREKSGLNTLKVAGRLNVINDGHWGSTPKDIDGLILPGVGKTKRIYVWHHLTYQQKPFPGAEGGMAAGILRKYPQFDLIVTGDNHCSFTEEYQGRRLVNPGNLTRQVADQADFQPRVALWYSEDNSIEWVNLPIQKDVISRDHLVVKEERDARIDAFVNSLDGEYKAGMSFEENLTIFLNLNPVRDSVKSIIYKNLE